MATLSKLIAYHSKLPPFKPSCPPLLPEKSPPQTTLYSEKHWALMILSLQAEATPPIMSLFH